MRQEATVSDDRPVRPKVTVVVCCHLEDRLELLRETINSLEAQTYENLEIQVVVDHNPGLAARLQGLSENSITVSENTNEPGLSGARNRGVELATGTLIAFIDDDARAEPTWISKLVASLDGKRVIAAGGKITPIWAGDEPPGWFPEEFLWVIGCSYRGLPDRGPVRNVIGCNMVFRSSVFEVAGGFSSDVGRLGSQLLGCEETELCIRAAGLFPEDQIIYVPEAVVHHHVPKSRQAIGYFLRRCLSEGMSKAVVRRLSGAASLNVEGKYVTRTLTGGILRNLGSALLLHRPKDSVSRAAVIFAGLAAVGAGFLIGSLRISSGQ